MKPELDLYKLIVDNADHILENAGSLGKEQAQRERVFAAHNYLVVYRAEMSALARIKPDNIIEKITEKTRKHIFNWAPPEITEITLPIIEGGLVVRRIDEEIDKIPEGKRTSVMFGDLMGALEKRCLEFGITW